MAKRITIKSYPSAPHVFLVKTTQTKDRSLLRGRRHRRPMTAMDETGQGAVPDLSEVLRAYRNRGR